MKDKLLETWIKVSKILNFEISIHFKLDLGNDITLEPAFLLPNFGATNGMLVFSSFSNISPYVQQIIDKKYGFTILSEASCDEDIDGYIEMLNDWGWSGDKNETPTWCV